jgi:hypothetical protein
MGYSFTIHGRNFYDMTTATVVENVYLGDYGVYLGQQGGGLWKDIFINNNRHYTEEVYGMPGSYYFGQVQTERRLQWPCYVNSITEEQLRDIQEILMVETPLRFQDEIRPYRYIYAVVDGQIDFDYIRANNYSGTFLLKLVAYDPFYYSFYTSLEEANLEYDLAQLYYDSGFLYSEESVSCTPTITSTSETFQLFNAGNTFANTKITMTNNGATPLTNIVLTNTNTSESFTISTLTVGGSVVIDGVRGMIFNLAESALLSSLFTGKFIRLKSNYNNFTITLSGSGVNLSLIFDYRHTYQ